MNSIFLAIDHTIQKILDKLRGKPNIPALSEYLTTLAGLVKMPKELDTVILGSSIYRVLYPYGFLSCESCVLLLIILIL